MRILFVVLILLFLNLWANDTRYRTYDGFTLGKGLLVDPISLQPILQTRLVEDEKSSPVNMAASGVIRFKNGKLCSLIDFELKIKNANEVSVIFCEETLDTFKLSGSTWTPKNKNGNTLQSKEDGKFEFYFAKEDTRVVFNSQGVIIEIISLFQTESHKKEPRHIIIHRESVADGVKYALTFDFSYTEGGEIHTGTLATFIYNEAQNYYEFEEFEYYYKTRLIVANHNSPLAKSKLQSSQEWGRQKLASVEEKEKRNAVRERVGTTLFVLYEANRDKTLKKAQFHYVKIEEQFERSYEVLYTRDKKVRSVISSNGCIENYSQTKNSQGLVTRVDLDCSKVPLDYPKGGFCTLIGEYDLGKLSERLTSIINFMDRFKTSDSALATRHAELHIDTAGNFKYYKGPALSGLGILSYELDYSLARHRINNNTAKVTLKNFDMYRKTNIYQKSYGMDIEWSVEENKILSDMDLRYYHMVNYIFNKMIMTNQFAFDPFLRICH